MLDVAKILAIPDDSPELLYSADPDEAKALYRRLAMQYHPDRAPGHEGVFKKVKELYEAAERKLSAGTWQVPGLAVFRTSTGVKYEFRYQARRAFDLGTEYIGRNTVAYEVFNTHADLFDNAVRAIESLKVPDKHKSQAVICLPQLQTHCRLLNSNRLLVIAKDPETIRLRDVLDHYKGKVPIKHAAWMVSRLCNIRALLQSAGVSHGDIGPGTLYCSPAKHTIALLGGWWYAQPLGERIRALPPRTMALAGAGLGKAPIAGPTLPGELVRATGRELLGDINGSRLLLDPAIPQQIVTWVRATPTASAYADYAEWMDRVLPAVFGPKRPFVHMDLTAEDVYGN